MGKPRKTAKEKFETKIRTTLGNYDAEYDLFPEWINNSISINGKIMFSYDENKVSYGLNRHFPNKPEGWQHIVDKYTVEVPLTHDNLALFGGNVILPPRDIGILNTAFSYKLRHFIIGGSENKLDEKTLTVTSEMFKVLKRINSAEIKEKRSRFLERAYPILNKALGIKLEHSQSKKDYSLILKECIA